MKPKIQLYYGVRGNNGEDEWYILQDWIHYGCIIKKSRRNYQFDKTTIYPNRERPDHLNETYTSLRAAAESYGTVTNSLSIQRIVKFWYNYIYTPYWAIHHNIADLLTRKKHED